jgi:hypothetical protein
MIVPFGNAPETDSDEPEIGCLAYRRRVQAGRSLPFEGLGQGLAVVAVLI